MEATQTQLQISKQENAALKSSLTTVDLDKKNLIELIDRRQQELDRLSEETASIRKYSESSRAKLIELKSKNAEIEGGDVTYKHLLETRDQELLQSKKHSEWLSDELNRKNEESRMYRTEKV